jgi:hypothetical protein
MQTFHHSNFKTIYTLDWGRPAPVYTREGQLPWGVNYPQGSAEENQGGWKHEEMEFRTSSQDAQA